ncbi:MAG: hypothetical protein H6581_06055 [Bacteroidia bacterium]|nr:hypothetical protein [Bacteroidia bacterium]
MKNLLLCFAFLALGLFLQAQTFGPPLGWKDLNGIYNGYSVAGLKAIQENPGIRFPENMSRIHLRVKNGKGTLAEVPNPAYHGPTEFQKEISKGKCRLEGDSLIVRITVRKVQHKRFRLKPKDQYEYHFGIELKDTDVFLEDRDQVTNFMRERGTDVKWGKLVR